MTFLQEAFDQVCTEAKQAESWYVALMRMDQRYIGPEEGGTWATDRTVVAYQHFDTKEGAEAAKDAVQKLAAELSTTASRDHGDRCLAEMGWLEARGLDADYLPEPDGPDEYYVTMSDRLPESRYGPTHYE